MIANLQDSPSRKPFPYFMLIVILICIGLPSRLTNWYPAFVETYVGDTLWAMMIYCLATLFLSRIAPVKLFVLSIAGTWFIEFSQLYQADWINNVRRLPLMGLVLGYGFHVEDLIAYTIGITTGLVIDLYLINRLRNSQQIERATANDD